MILNKSKVIIEGVDGSGKSTLAVKIQEENPEMNYKIVHCTRNTTNDFQFFASLLTSEDNIIFDRFCYGQFVYQNSEERKSKNWMSLSDLQSLEIIIRCLDAIVIFVTGDIERIYENCKKDRDDSSFTLDHVKKINDKFSFVFSNVTSLTKENLLVYSNDFGDRVAETDLSDFDFSMLSDSIWVDFDGNLVTGAVFPEIGEINEELRHELFDEDGFWYNYKKILFTCRNGQHLIEAVAFCQDNGMYFDSYNKNLPEVIKAVGGDTRKVYATIGIDDKVINTKDIKAYIEEQKKKRAEGNT